MHPFSCEPWPAIDALGQAVDQDLARLGLTLTLGGVAAYDAGATSLPPLDCAHSLRRHLQMRWAEPGSLQHQGGDRPQTLGCFWRLDGVPLWRNETWLVTTKGTLADDRPPVNNAAAATFLTELRQCLAIAPEAVLTVRSPETGEPVGYLLPLLLVAQTGAPQWVSCRWHRQATPLDSLPLLPGPGPLPTRVPSVLGQAQASLTEACLPLSAAPIRPQTVATLAPPNSIGTALAVEARDGQLHVSLPRTASARSYVDLLTAIEATAEALDQPVVITGLTPPLGQGIEGFEIICQGTTLTVVWPGVHCWPALRLRHQHLAESAAAIGLQPPQAPVPSLTRPVIHLGGPTPADSPWQQRLDLLRSLITYWQHHPSLSYWFLGQPFPHWAKDNAEHLYELELAFLGLRPKAAVPGVVLDQLLRPLLTDTATAKPPVLSLESLFPIEDPRQQLGQIQCRGCPLLLDDDGPLLLLLLLRACVSWFGRHPYTQPLLRWPAAEGDRYHLPYFLMQDFQRVLTDLAAAGYVVSADWFTLLWERAFPRYGQVSLLDNSARMLELRAAWEEDGLSQGDRRARLQVRLTGAVGNSPAPQSLSQRYTVLCNGYPVPMRSTGTAGEYIGGVRFRTAPLRLGPRTAMTAHNTLHFVVVDTWKHCSVGGAVYRSDPDAAPTTRGQFIPDSQPPCPPDPLPAMVLHPDAPMTLDLRLVQPDIPAPAP